LTIYRSRPYQPQVKVQAHKKKCSFRLKVYNRNWKNQTK